MQYISLGRAGLNHSHPSFTHHIILFAFPLLTLTVNVTQPFHKDEASTSHQLEGAVTENGSPKEGKKSRRLSFPKSREGAGRLTGICGQLGAGEKRCTDGWRTSIAAGAI